VARHDSPEEKEKKKEKNAVLESGIRLSSPP